MKSRKFILDAAAFMFLVCVCGAVVSLLLLVWSSTSAESVTQLRCLGTYAIVGLLSWLTFNAYKD